MEWLTFGFIGVVIVIMAIKILFEWNMYKKSMYSILYSSFTEYRIRRKTVSRMSESMKLKELFGAARILYHVLDEKQNKPSSFVTIFLSTGCYVVGVSKKIKVERSLFVTTERFLQENITAKLDNTIYSHQQIPTHVLLLVPENADNIIKCEASDRYIAERNNLMEIISEIHNASKKIFTEEDIEHICQLFIKDTANAENALTY